MNWTSDNRIAWLRLIPGPVRFGAGCLAVSILAASCIGLREPGKRSEKTTIDRGYRFSHELHREKGLEDCSVCHDVTAESPRALSLPGHELCGVCHEIPESDTKPPAEPEERAKCDWCHTRPDYSISAWQSTISGDVLWKHKPHLDAEVDCLQCHREMDARRVPAAPMKPVCIECHAERGPAQTECRVCHAEITRDTIPTHRHGQVIAHDSPAVWEKIHGLEARIDPAYCAQCHETQNRCDTCHSQTPPKDHTLTWKRRTHGLMASWDRNRCAACHEETECVKCHKNSQPVSHRGGWDAPLNRHCVNCHFPAERTGCIVCHENIEHETASKSPHNFGLVPANCGMCHPGGLPHRAPHPVNSSVHCASCHR